MIIVQPPSLYSAASSEYFVLLYLWAPCISFSQGMVNSVSRVVLPTVDQSTRSGCSGNLRREMQLLTDVDPHFPTLSWRKESHTLSRPDELVELDECFLAVLFAACLQVSKT